MFLNLWPLQWWPEQLFSSLDMASNFCKSLPGVASENCGQIICGSIRFANTVSILFLDYKGACSFINVLSYFKMGPILCGALVVFLFPITWIHDVAPGLLLLDEEDCNLFF